MVTFRGCIAIMATIEKHSQCDFIWRNLEKAAMMAGYQCFWNVTSQVAVLVQEGEKWFGMEGLGQRG